MVSFSNGNFETDPSGSTSISGWFSNHESYNSQTGDLFAIAANGPNGQFVQQNHEYGPGAIALVSGYFTGQPATVITFQYQVNNQGGDVRPDSFSATVQPNQQARVDVYDASDPRICSLDTYIYNTGSAEAGPYLGTLLLATAAEASNSAGWQSFSAPLGQIVGSGKPVVLAFRVVFTEAPYLLAADSVTFS